VIDYFRHYWGTWDDYVLEPTEIIDAGEDRVIVVHYERGRGRGSGVPFERRWAASSNPPPQAACLLQPAERAYAEAMGQKTSSGFGGIKQVGVGVSIGFPLLVVGVLMLALLTISVVGIGTLLWILAGAMVGAGLLAAASRWLF
jgi:hypothetical protein